MFRKFKKVLYQVLSAESTWNVLEIVKFKNFPNQVKKSKS